MVLFAIIVSLPGLPNWPTLEVSHPYTSRAKWGIGNCCPAWSAAQQRQLDVVKQTEVIPEEPSEVLMRLVRDIDTFVLYESNQAIILWLVITRLVWDIKTSQALHNLNDWKLVGIPHVTRPQGETLFIRAPLSLLHLLGIVSLWWIFFGPWDEELYGQHQISYYIVLPSSHKVPPVCRQYPSLNYSPEMLHQMWSKGWGHAEAAWAFEQSVGKSPRFWWSSSGIQRAELHAILTDFVFPTWQYCVACIIYSPVNVIVLHDCLGRTFELRRHLRYERVAAWGPSPQCAIVHGLTGRDIPWLQNAKCIIGQVHLAECGRCLWEVWGS